MSVWAAGILAAGTIASSAIQSKSSKKAAEAQERAGERGIEQLQPFTEAARGALEQRQSFSGLLGPEAQQEAFSTFQEDPGVQFLREQGLRGIEQRAASTGGLGGSNRLKELIGFSQNLALQSLGQRRAELADITRLGLSGAQSAQAPIARIGQAEAVGEQQKGQAFQSGLEGLAGLGLGVFGAKAGSAQTSPSPAAPQAGPVGTFNPQGFGLGTGQQNQFLT